ncbi:hypothetical protein ACIP9H_33555 [Streptomyces sp. NPDC088732]|uniref:hypothetical protein n=1 Tax=Streptomyces sp. NPDC088732 TaxID=3365879 RepID=UPI00381A7710
MAGALAGPTVRSSAARTKQTQDAMLLAFRRSMNPQTSRDDAGSSDGLEETELHRQEAELPGGGRLVVSDIEEISPARLEEARSQFAAILERRSKDSHR